MRSLDDTIAAIATGPGEGGIAIVRVSGPDTKDIGAIVVQRVSGGGAEFNERSVQIMRVVGGEALLDEAVVLWMPGPASYTREDVLEIQCHGGMAAARAALDRVLAAGARLAEPGEFTLRAFLRGRIDLVQAEAVLDVIRSRTEESLRIHQQTLGGRLSGVVEDWQLRLGKILVELEAQLDFAEEEDVGSLDVEECVSLLEGVERDLLGCLASYDWGRRNREGFSVALIGMPNTGKSSLLNALVDEERAIVSADPGTTRDCIDVWVNACGVPVRVVDTAGLRDTDNPVENEGVARSRRIANGADLVLFVCDGSRALLDEEKREAAVLHREQRVLAVVNKVDLGHVPAEELKELFDSDVVFLSAKTGKGILQLLETLRERAWRGAKGLNSDDPVLTRERQRRAVESGVDRVRGAIAALRNSAYMEVAASEVHAARRHLAELLGWGTEEDVLEAIFSEFCIGK